MESIVAARNPKLPTWTPPDGVDTQPQAGSDADGANAQPAEPTQGSQNAFPLLTIGNTPDGAFPQTELKPRRLLGAGDASPIGVPFEPGAAVVFRSSDYTTVVSGGLWAHEPPARPMTPSDIGAAPVLTHPEARLESTALAQQLANGSSVQSLLGDHPSAQQLDAMNDAFELLGISNRQIAIYAKQSALGGYDLGSGRIPEAHKLLVDAGHMRAAVDADSKAELSGYRYNLLGERFQATSVPDAFSANGMIRSVQAGAAESKQYWQPKVAAMDMVYGASTTGIARSRSAMFPDRLFTNTYEYGARQGADLLKTTHVATWARAGGALAEKAQDAAGVLAAPAPAEWTPQAVTEAFYAAAALRQGISYSVQQHYVALERQNPGLNSAADQAGLLRQAVDQALAEHGVTGIDAQRIGERLLEASTSPAFEQLAAGDQNTANSAYALMSYFDPQATQRAAVIGKLTGTPSTPEGQVEQKAARMLLTSLANSGASKTPPTPEETASAAATVSQWSIGSARWAMAALGKGSKPMQEKIDAYGRYLNEAVQRVRFQMTTLPTGAVSVALPTEYVDAAGTVIGSTMEDVQHWASQRAGLLGDKSWQSYLQTSGADLARAIDRYGIGAIAAAGSAVNRAYRLANPGTYQFDDATRSALIANTVADVSVITEWATNARRLGPAVGRGIRALEDAIPGGGWFGRGGVQPPADGGVDHLAELGQAGLYAISQAAGNPTPADPQTPLGRFVNWALPQAGGFGNLIYGGSNIATGLRQIAGGGPYVSGALTTVAGAIDFFNGLAQLKSALPDLPGRWNAINTFGYDYPVWAQTTTRLIASAAGVANAVLASQNG